MVTNAAVVLDLYARGLFPMDEEGAPELPWWVADPRTIFELDEHALERTRRAARRSLAKARPGWELRRDAAFEDVLERCARPRHPGDGVWLSGRMKAMYRTLRATGHATTFELWDGGACIAGIVGVVIGRAAMLESMTHSAPHAGNVLLVRTLDLLAGAGCELCDIQTATEHTTRLGAVQVPRSEYERRLHRALRA